jgi:polyisoprenyl-teichoic acid--peptidoglycan teichoic acid transferase
MRRRAAAIVAALALVTALWPLLSSRPATHAASLVAGRVHSTFQPQRGKIFVLIIGSDARVGNPDRVRADALHIIGINTKTMRGGILNFPRDSWVNIPGHGPGRINEALYRGGPRLVARTLEALTGVRLDYWVMTGFEGFRGIVEDIGGVKITLHRAIFDPGGSGARLRAGTQFLSAGESLAYVRTRKAFSGGDVDRSSNQARFLLLLLAKLRNKVEHDPGTMLDWLASVRRHTRTDIAAEEMFRLGVLATQMSRKDIDSVTVPVSIGSVGSASVVFISSRANSIYARFRRTARL